MDSIGHIRPNYKCPPMRGYALICVICKDILEIVCHMLIMVCHLLTRLNDQLHDQLCHDCHGCRYVCPH